MHLDNLLQTPFFLKEKEHAKPLTQASGSSCKSNTGTPHKPVMSIGEATIDVASLDNTALLTSWSWLVFGDTTPLLMTAFGDLFLQSPDDQVWFLDLVSGEYNFVASSTQEWMARFEEPRIIEEWLMPRLIQSLLDHQLTLDPGTCYGFKVPPIIGGKVEISNIEPTNLAIYYSLTGKIHKQARDLPPGTPFSTISVDGYTS